MTGRETAVRDADSQKAWHSLHVDEIFRVLETSENGLAEAEARRRLQVFGENVIPKEKPQSPVKLFLKQFKDFFIVALLFAAFLSYSIGFIPGQSPRVETAIFILIIAFATVTLRFVEEYRARKTIEALGKIIERKAIAVRDGYEVWVPVEHLVPGDIIVLKQGMTVPADARLLDSYGLIVDEAFLTGESRGVVKDPSKVLPSDAEITSRVNMVYAGSHVLRGKARAVVVETGANTEMGKLASELIKMEESLTPFQKEFKHVEKQVTYIVVALSVVLGVIMYFWQHLPLIDVALNAVAIAASAIPTSLPIVLTFGLAMGARRMAKRNALTKRLDIVEGMGSVDIILSDKTGTMTRGKLSVQEIYVGGKNIILSENPGSNALSIVKLETQLEFKKSLKLLALCSILCNDATTERDDKREVRFVGDPVDVALMEMAQRLGINVAETRKAFNKVGDIPFTPERRMSTSIYHDGRSTIAFCKGAPETILEKCSFVMLATSVVEINGDLKNDLQKVLENMYSKGLYVVALAFKKLEKVNNNETKTQTLENNLILIGFVGMLDPPKTGVKDAVEKLARAGVKTIMVTGDNVLTAKAVGKQVGLEGGVVEAREIANLPPDELYRKLQSVKIIARATPDIKEKIVEALQNQGHFVAMTGDGINDSTAMKKANVSVAMGSGTDVSKDVASMILLDDNFATICAAVEEGRRIFDNIRKFSNYLLSTAIASIVTIVVLTLMGYPLPVTGTMALWVDLLTDIGPATALALDPAVPNIMSRRPKKPEEKILNRTIWELIIWSGVRTTIIYTVIFHIGLWMGGYGVAKAMIFTAIVLHAFTRICVVRTIDGLSIMANKLVPATYALSLVLQATALYTPLRSLFGVEPLPLTGWIILFPLVAASSALGYYHSKRIVEKHPVW